VTHAYPAALAEFVRERWKLVKEEQPAELCTLPAGDTLERLLSTSYQATLLHDEDRPVRFRLIVGAPGSFAENGGPPDGLHRMVLTRPRPFTEHELRRLSPAAKYERTLIGVEANAHGELAIWGILQSGPRWLEAVRGGRRSLATLPSRKLVVRASAPGRIAVASGSTTLGEIRGGKITEPSSDVFESRWLPNMFRREREELAVLHAEARQGTSAPWAELHPDVTRWLSQQMVKRMIATISAAHHGGTIVVLAPERADVATCDLLRVTYAFEDAEPRRRFRSLILAAMRDLAASHAREGNVGWQAYRSSESRALGAIDEAVFEVPHLVAALADVDGAVVMTKRFEILGFGAEIAGDFPDVLTVMRALDVEGTDREEETLEGVGTRHRSAYRLASRERDALVVVVSQDGPVRFVAWKDGAVTYWDQAWLDSS
jgi:hypothetical protein